MVIGKQRSPQQQTDEQATRILIGKTPSGIVFREQGEDYGIDCELEQFTANPDRPGFEKSTGVLFKGQLKGTARARELEVADGTALSKQFDVDDLYYWYEQLSVPVILFLVDVDTQVVYWTEFYSDPDLRAGYRRARQGGQASLSVRFRKSSTFPETLEGLLQAVEHAYECIALSAAP